VLQKHQRVSATRPRRLVTFTGQVFSNAMELPQFSAAQPVAYATG